MNKKLLLLFLMALTLVSCKKSYKYVEKVEKQGILGGTEREEKEEEFNDLTFEQQKEVILLAIDKNKLYVNASQIDDEEINLSDYEKKLTLNFYGKESPDDTRQGTLSI